MEPIDEDALLERCKRGDERALKLLIDRYQQPIFGLVSCLVPCNRDTAYALTLSSFVDGIRACESSQTTGSCLQTLLRVVVKQARDVQLTPLFEDPHLPHLPPEKRQLLRIVKQAILALRFEARLFILLRDQLGLRYEDIASIMGLSVKRARAETTQARVLLREKTREAMGRVR